MGKLIRCSGKLAENPYLFPVTMTRVFSIEEVCYYIRNNIYMMQEEVFDEEFARWIREELGMSATADKLEKMRRDQNNLKDIVVTLCCSCDYYSEEQINELIEIMDQTQNLPMRGRRKIKADSYMKSGRLTKAKQEYENILKSDDMLDAAPEEYGAVYHSLGMVCAGMGEYFRAAQAFQKAYEQNHCTQSLEAYLYSLLLGDLEDEYEKAVKELDISREQQSFLRTQYEEAVQLSRESKPYRQIGRLTALWDQGKEEEYRERVHGTIGQWKKEYRKF